MNCMVFELCLYKTVTKKRELYNLLFSSLFSLEPTLVCHSYHTTKELLQRSSLIWFAKYNSLLLVLLFLYSYSVFDTVDHSFLKLFFFFSLFSSWILEPPLPSLADLAYLVDLSNVECSGVQSYYLFCSPAVQIPQVSFSSWF